MMLYLVTICKGIIVTLGTFVILLKTFQFFFLFLQQDMVINLIDVGGQRSERKKWALIFRTVQAVIFVASLIEFDQVCT